MRSPVESRADASDPESFLLFPPSFLPLSPVPIIVFALLLFVLLAFAGVVLLSLALRYRAGTARRQARRWVASLNVWMTSFSAVFFLSFTFLLSFWVDSAFRFALIGMGCGGILGLVGLAMTRWESQPEGLFYTPSRWLALFITLAIAARFVYGWWRATHSGSNAHWRSALADHRLWHAAFPGSRCRIDRLLSGVLRWSASATHAARATAIQLNESGKQEPGIRLSVDKKFYRKPGDQEWIKKHVADSPWRESRTGRKYFPGFLLPD